MIQYNHGEKKIESVFNKNSRTYEFLYFGFFIQYFEVFSAFNCFWGKRHRPFFDIPIEKKLTVLNTAVWGPLYSVFISRVATYRWEINAI